MVCVDLEIELSQASDTLSIARARNRLVTHLYMIHRERDLYALNRVDANFPVWKLQDPYARTSMSVIFDTMDQAKAGIPNSVSATTRKTDKSESAIRMKNQLIGLVNHRHTDGQSTVRVRLVLGGEFPSDANSNIQVLWNEIVAFSDYYGRLPRVLNIQMDNTGKDNKNRHMFAFAGWLVARGVFEEVRLNSLHVSHTHEDVDRWFSRFSVALSTFHEKNIIQRTPRGVESIGDLLQCLRESVSPPPDVQVIEAVWDWITFLKPVSMATIEGTMSNRAFKFAQNASGEVTLAFRPWMVPPDSFLVTAAGDPFPWDGTLANIPYLGPLVIPGYDECREFNLKSCPRFPLNTSALRSSVEELVQGGHVSRDGATRFFKELDDIDARNEREIQTSSCSECAELRRKLHALVIHRSDKKASSDDTGTNLFTQKQSERKLLKEKLAEHCRAQFDHPCVSLRMPISAPRPLSERLQASETRTRNQEIEALTQTMNWVQSRKQSEHWATLLASDQKQLETLLSMLEERVEIVRRELDDVKSMPVFHPSVLLMHSCVSAAVSRWRHTHCTCRSIFTCTGILFV